MTKLSNKELLVQEFTSHIKESLQVGLKVLEESIDFFLTTEEEIEDKETLLKHSKARLLETKNLITALDDYDDTTFHLDDWSGIEDRTPEDVKQSVDYYFTYNCFAAVHFLPGHYWKTHSIEQLYKDGIVGMSFPHGELLPPSESGILKILNNCIPIKKQVIVKKIIDKCSNCPDYYRTEDSLSDEGDTYNCKTNYIKDKCLKVSRILNEVHWEDGKWVPEYNDDIPVWCPLDDANGLS